MKRGREEGTSADDQEYLSMESSGSSLSPAPASEGGGLDVIAAKDFLDDVCRELQLSPMGPPIQKSMPAKAENLGNESKDTDQLVHRAIDIVNIIENGDVEAINKLMRVEDFELTEKNIEEFENRLKQRGFELEHLRAQVIDKPTEPAVTAPQMGKQQMKTNKAMEKLIEEGNIEPKSYHGKLFRENVKTDTSLEREYNALIKCKDNAGLAKMWMDWAIAKVKPATQVFETKRCYQQISTTTGTMMNLSQLVVEQGGCNDPLAIQGALRLVGQCFLMGGKWRGTHTQTGRDLYRLLKFEDQDVFAEMWTDFKKHLEDVANTQGIPTSEAAPRTNEGTTDGEAEKRKNDKGDETKTMDSRGREAHIEEDIGGVEGNRPKVPKERSESQLLWQQALLQVNIDVDIDVGVDIDIDIDINVDVDVSIHIDIDVDVDVDID